MPETRGAPETGTAPSAAAVRFTPVSCPCGSNENETISPRGRRPRGPSPPPGRGLALPAPAAAPALATRAAEYDSMGVLPETPFSSGSAGASRAATSARVAVAAADGRPGVFVEKRGVVGQLPRVTAADNAASMLTLPSSSSSSSEDPSSTAVWFTSPTMPAISPPRPRATRASARTGQTPHARRRRRRRRRKWRTPARRASPPTSRSPRRAFGGARARRRRVCRVARVRVGVTGGVVRAACSSGAADLRPPQLEVLELTHAKRTAFSRSAPPALMSASAERTAATVASVAAASVASAGQVDATSTSAAAEVAPSASRTRTATTTAPPSASRPPGSVPRYDARGLKSWSCCSLSAAGAPTTRAVNL